MNSQLTGDSHTDTVRAMAEKTLAKISYDEALDLLNRAVDEKGPWYIYPQYPDRTVGCVYAVRGEDRELIPSCIVGHVVNYINPSLLEELHAREGRGAYLVLPTILDLDVRTTELLATAQRLQDKGAPWGESVSIASRKV